MLAVLQVSRFELQRADWLPVLIVIVLAVPSASWYDFDDVFWRGCGGGHLLRSGLLGLLLSDNAASLACSD